MGGGGAADFKNIRVEVKENAHLRRIVTFHRFTRLNANHGILTICGGWARTFWKAGAVV